MGINKERELKAVKTFRDEIESEYQGTSLLDDRLQDVEIVEEAVTQLHELKDKIRKMQEEPDVNTVLYLLGQIETGDE